VRDTLLKINIYKKAGDSNDLKYGWGNKNLTIERRKK